MSKKTATTREMTRECYDIAELIDSGYHIILDYAINQVVSKTGMNINSASDY